MTDTTDIAALREAALKALGIMDGDEPMIEGWDLHPDLVEPIKETANLIISILDQLETERQRADELVKTNARLYTRASKAEKSNTFLKEELAKLANFNPDWDMLEVCRESWREVVDLLKERNVEIAALKAKLANPVVLPRHVRSKPEADDTQQAFAQGCNTGIDTCAEAIRLAGFMVKE